MFYFIAQYITPLKIVYVEKKQKEHMANISGGEIERGGGSPQALAKVPLKCN